MPFGLLMTEALRQRQARDREKGYPKEYIRARHNLEVWYVLSYALALAAIATVNWIPMGISVLMRTAITGVASIIFAFSVWRFLKSIRSQ